MRLGGDDDRLGRARQREFQDRAGRSHLVGMIQDIGRAFRVRRDRRVGILRLQLQKLGLAERLVDDAGARPQQHVAPGLAVEIGAQILVGREDDLLVHRQLRQDLFRRGAGDDDVRMRLHRRRAVDVGDGDMIGVRRAEPGELFRRAAILQRAAGIHVRQDHRLFRAQYLGDLGHEAHAAEGDHIGAGVRRLAAQVQAVAHEIGQVLNIGRLVIMGQDHGVALLAQPFDLRAQVQPGEAQIGGIHGLVPLCGRAF
ncbi:hypothetical protein BHE75_01218 [Sphingomonas haloaromaticamans]|uniref:Uncharacterized protein n=1 Tax=Edaphosphingomonas haloaromaticamans TaxID=653954 RepID=A0A1S1HAW8_9SPHN|nr:hypothetical protein BHE75_01218 [Sphingomonas haloaromaticamans]